MSTKNIPMTPHDAISLYSVASLSHAPQHANPGTRSVWAFHCRDASPGTVVVQFLEQIKGQPHNA
jgi:hypothetical protein